MRRVPSLLLCTLLSLSVSACAAEKPSPVRGYGPAPELPAPQSSLLPTLNYATPVGWAKGATPIATAGTQVRAFAQGLDHPRWLYALPNGDVLVAESNAPPKQAEGLKDWVAGKVQQRAGARTPSADRITLLRDSDGDGVAEQHFTLLQNLHSPFGMALVDDDLYVANADALVKFPYRNGDTRIAAPAQKVVDLPAGINHHWTKNVIASPDGRKLYITVGSNSNVGENGMDAERGRAAIWEFDLASGKMREFASGLRNPNGMDWNPQTGELWTVVNERDELGNDLVPDYATSVRDGAFYGWPYSYYGQHVDERVKPQRPDLVAKAVVPDYALGAHTAALGMAFARDNQLPASFRSGLFVGQHGSWNRTPRAGYKVIFVPFRDGRPDGMPIDVLSGFLDADGNAQGRPVGVIEDRHGGVLVADDVGNTIWRVSAAPAGNAQAAPR